MRNKQDVPSQAYGIQAQLTLVSWCLLKYRDARTVAYENQDDITVTLDSGKKIFIQSKTGKQNPFLNGCIDFWKTLYNWTNQCTQGAEEEFIFAVTKNYKKGDILSLIIESQKTNNFNAVFDLINKFYAQTKNKRIKRAISMIRNARIKLTFVFSNINILIHTNPLHQVLKDELATYNEQPELIEPLYESLLSWVQKEIEKLTIINPKSILIDKEEFSKYHYVRRRALTNHVKYTLSPPQINNESKEKLSGNTFIRQLDMIELDDTHKDKAIIHYLHAEHYREELIRAGEIIANDIIDEENDLISYWQDASITPQFQSPVEKGKAIFSECMRYRGSPLFLRSQIASISQGTFHMLADGVLVRWHPNFE